MKTEDIILLGFCISVLIFGASLVLNVVMFVRQYTLHNRIKQSKARLSALSQNALDGLRLEWLAELSAGITYRNEIEVEIKFIHPLLYYLGYALNDLQIRVPVNVQAGRKIKTVHADWVVFSQGVPYFVVEAKEQNQTLNQDVQGQARSYAYGLNVSKYIITNGRELEIYRRGNEADTKILNCEISDMTTKWEKIKTLIGKP
jgi:hypothetical protein